MKERVKKFVEAYRKKTGTVCGTDATTEDFIIEGLAAGKERFGAQICPCRFYPQGKEQAAKEKIYTCPCYEMRTAGECH